MSNFIITFVENLAAFMFGSAVGYVLFYTTEFIMDVVGEWRDSE